MNETLCQEKWEAGAQATAQATAQITGLRDELKHRERQIAAICHLSDALYSRSDLDDLIRETLTVAIEVLDADTGSLQLHDPVTDALVFRFVASSTHAELLGHAMPTSQGISGRVFRTGISDLATDVRSNPDFNPAIDVLTGYQTKSALTVPLKRASGAAIGVMQVLNVRRAFLDRDLEVLEVLGGQAATAIENARVAELARQVEIVNVIGNVAHDIYNLLTPLEVGVHTLRETTDSLFGQIERVCRQEAGAPWCAELSAASDEAKSECEWILDQALSSSKRVQARTRWIAGAVKGRLPQPVFEEADLNDTTRQVAGALVSLAKKRGVALRIELDAALPPTRCDPEHIYNALYNLVNNAIPETPSGGAVTLRTRGPRPGDDTILLEVEDTGRGMAPDVVDKLFTEAMVSTKAEGTGLGTRIVQHVVEQHGGQISVASEVGQGSRFSIRLPLK